MSIERILTDPIPENKAIEFISKFKIEEANNGNYKIPTAWLFEKGIIESFEIPNLTGLSFYSAIDNEKQPDQDGKYPLTFIMVPVIVNSKGVLKDLTDETMYEFSQFCPTICSVNVKGNFILKDATFTVPTSFYIPKNFIEQLFVDHPTSKGIRLYRHIIENKLELSIVPVADVPPNYNDLISPDYNPNIIGICEESNQTFCDLTSILYNA
jgi:hypothetical protein